MSIEPVTMTLKCVLETSAAAYDRRPALGRVNGETIDYGNLRARVRALSADLESTGVTAGDRVAILGENMPNWSIAFFAITTMGAVAVPILPDFSAAEAQHIIRHSGAKVAFVSERHRSKLEEDGDSPLRTVYRLDDFGVIVPHGGKGHLRTVIAHDAVVLGRLREAVKGKADRTHEVAEDDLASIIYTSGTTGHSKGVMLTHRNLVADAVATTKIIELGPTDRLLSILPLSHAYECTLGLILVIYVGASVYYLDKPPTARVMLPALAEVKPTVICSVPLVIEKIYKAQVLPAFTKRRLTRALYGLPPARRAMNRLAGKKVLRFFGGELRNFCIGGASLAADVERFLREARFPYCIGYGLTEASPLLAGSDPEHAVSRACGRPLPGVEIRIADPDPATGEGEIVARGPMIMKGYYQDPERTAEVLSEDGWLRTGDLGILDREGTLFIKGRRKNVIVGPNGENVYPEEIEDLVCGERDVLEALVYQQGSQLWARVHLDYPELDRRFSARGLTGAESRAAVAARLEEVRAHVNGRVKPSSRIDRIIEQIEPFEKTPTQKIKRYLYV